MAIPHAQPGEIVDVRPLGPKLTAEQTKTLVRGEQLEIIRLIVPAGKVIDEHRAKGEITVHCLEGKAEFTALGKTQILQAGEMMYLSAGAPHSVKGIEDGSILLTIALPQH